MQRLVFKTMVVVKATTLVLVLSTSSYNVNALLDPGLVTVDLFVPGSILLVFEDGTDALQLCRESWGWKHRGTTPGKIGQRTKDSQKMPEYYGFLFSWKSSYCSRVPSLNLTAGVVRQSAERGDPEAVLGPEPEPIKHPFQSTWIRTGQIWNFLLEHAPTPRSASLIYSVCSLL